MEGRAEALSKELQDLLQKAAEVSLQLEEALRRRESRPHYSQIEARVHALGRDLQPRGAAAENGGIGGGSARHEEMSGLWDAVPVRAAEALRQFD